MLLNYLIEEEKHMKNEENFNKDTRGNRDEKGVQGAQAGKTGVAGQADKKLNQKDDAVCGTGSCTTKK